MGSRTEPVSQESSWPTTVRGGPFLLGAASSFLLPMGLLPRLLLAAVVHTFSMPPLIAFGLLSLVEDGFAAFVLITIVLAWEGLPLSSIGIRLPPVVDVAYALAAAVASICLVSVMELHAYRVTPSSQMAATERGVTALAALPLWLQVVGSLGNGIAEEIGARGYVMERILSATCSPVLAVSVSGVGSALIHIPGWGTHYALAVLPGETIFALLYLFRRNIWVCAAAHFFADGFAGIIWPLLPGAAKVAFWRAINAL